jgi:hypothetical protein
MKKIAIGCVVLLLVLGAAGTAGSYLLYRRVGSTVSSYAELGKVPALNASVRNQEPFTPPASGEPSARQVERLLAVQQAVRTRGGEWADEFERTYRKLLTKANATAADAPAILAAYRDLAGGYMEVKRAQVDALNAAGLSLAEYRWIRSQVYSTLGMPLMDVEALVSDVRSGRAPRVPAAAVPLEPTGSPELRKRLEPHRKALERYAPLAFFGM